MSDEPIEPRLDGLKMAQMKRRQLPSSNPAAKPLVQPVAASSRIPRLGALVNDQNADALTESYYGANAAIASGRRIPANAKSRVATDSSIPTPSLSSIHPSPSAPINPSATGILSRRTNPNSSGIIERERKAATDRQFIQQAAAPLTQPLRGAASQSLASAPLTSMDIGALRQQMKRNIQPSAAGVLTKRTVQPTMTVAAPSHTTSRAPSVSSNASSRSNSSSRATALSSQSHDDDADGEHRPDLDDFLVGVACKSRPAPASKHAGKQPIVVVDANDLLNEEEQGDDQGEIEAEDDEVFAADADEVEEPLPAVQMPSVKEAIKQPQPPESNPKLASPLTRARHSVKSEEAARPSNIQKPELQHVEAEVAPAVADPSVINSAAITTVPMRFTPMGAHKASNSNEKPAPEKPVTDAKPSTNQIPSAAAPVNEQLKVAAPEKQPSSSKLVSAPMAPAPALASKAAPVPAPAVSSKVVAATSKAIVDQPVPKASEPAVAQPARPVTKVAPAHVPVAKLTSEAEASIPSAKRDAVHKGLEALLLEAPVPHHTTALTALRQLIANLLIKPPKDVFRSLRIKNPQFQQRLSKFGSARAFLKIIGFEEREMQDPATIVAAPVEKKANDYAPTLAYGSGVVVPENNSVAAGSTDDEEKKAAAELEAAAAEVNEQAAGVEPIIADTRRLTASEKREQQERMFLVLPHTAETEPWYPSLLQFSIDRIDTVFLPRVVAAAAELASMDAESRYQLEVKDVRSALDNLCNDQSMQPPDLAQAIASLRQIFKNLSIQPPQAKFRKLQLQNQVFHTRLGRWPFAIKFLKSIGFREAGGQLFLLPAFEKPQHQMVRISGWLDGKAPELDKASAAFLKKQSEAKDVAEFLQQQEAKQKQKELERAAKQLESSENPVTEVKLALQSAFDRGVRVFAVSMLATMSKLQAKPVELDSIEDPDVQDQIDARQNSATDKALILDAQSSWARTQDRLLAKQRLRLQERTGIAFPEPAPIPQDKLTSKEKKELAAAARLAEVRAAESQQTSIRFVFSDSGAVVQTLFHRKEHLSAVFAFVRACLVHDATRFTLRLPPATVLRDDMDVLLESVGLIGFVNLFVNFDDSAEEVSSSHELQPSLLEQMEQHEVPKTETPV